MSDLATAARQGVAAARGEKAPPPTARETVEKYAPEFERALAGTIDTQHFVRTVLTVLTNTPKLQVVTQQSLIASVLLAAQLRLEIGGGLNQFHLTPRNVKERYQDEDRQWQERWVDVCVPIIGYQGWTTLAYRNQRTLDFNKVRVYEADDFEDGYTSERGKYFEWHPGKGSAFKGERGALVGVLVASRTVGGGRIETYLTAEEIEARRPASSKEQTTKYGARKGEVFTPNTPWKTDWPAMADKTVVREHAKLLPKSVELQRAIALDERLLVRTAANEVDALPEARDEDA